MMFFNNVQQVSGHAYHADGMCPKPRPVSVNGRADAVANCLCCSEALMSVLLEWCIVPVGVHVQTLMHKRKLLLCALQPCKL